MQEVTRGDDRFSRNDNKEFCVRFGICLVMDGKRIPAAFQGLDVCTGHKSGTLPFSQVRTR